MAETKSTTLTVRVHPVVKEGPRAVTEQKRRSLANMIKIMIRNCCAHNGVSIENSGSAG